MRACWRSRRPKGPTACWRGSRNCAKAGALRRLPRGEGSPAWLVDLASVPAGQGVLPAVRGALGLQVAGLDGLDATVGAGEALIVLDNCEHVVADAAAVAADLLATCPGLRMLATSRECLGVPGEVVQRIPDLRGVVGAEAHHAQVVGAERDRVGGYDAFFDRLQPQPRGPPHRAAPRGRPLSLRSGVL